MTLQTEFGALSSDFSAAFVCFEFGGFIVFASIILAFLWY